MKKLLCFMVFLALPRVTAGAPAVRLVVTNDPCLYQICPHPIPVPTSVASGAPFDIAVIAVDGADLRDATYTGTVTFTSTDPLATLPSNYTFLPTDQGRRGFIAILRTPGTQTITVTVPGLVPGTLTLTVTGPQVAESVPTLSEWMKILLGLGLAISAIWLLRLRT